jgi:predicted metal-dependent phosphoesterase TrpH
MHTTTSDGLATVQEVLEDVARRGHLDVIAITDHNLLDASLWAYSQRSRYPFDIIPGVEISSADGHVVGLWVTKPIAKGKSLAETVAAIHEQGGFAFLAHPLEPIILPRTLVWRYVMHPEVLQESGADGVEVFNSGTLTPGNSWLTRRRFGSMGLTLLGNSDAHVLGSVGRAVTRFPGRTAADLRLALDSGQTAVEGKHWPISDLWKLLINAKARKLSRFLAANPRFARLTRQ